VLAVPRVAAGSLERRARVAVAAAASELDHRELGGEDGTTSFQLRDNGRVLPDDLIAIRRCAPGRRRTASREQILGPVRDPGERAALLLREGKIGALGLVKGALRHERRNRVVFRTELS